MLISNEGHQYPTKAIEVVCNRSQILLLPPLPLAWLWMGSDSIMNMANGAAGVVVSKVELRRSIEEIECMTQFRCIICSYLDALTNQRVLPTMF